MIPDGSHTERLGKHVNTMLGNEFVNEDLCLIVLFRLCKLLL